jgi:hypothetical protein
MIIVVIKVFKIIYVGKYLKFLLLKIILQDCYKNIQ